MPIVAQRRRPSSLAFYAILSKHADCCAPADRGSDPGGGALETDASRNTERRRDRAHGCPATPRRRAFCPAEARVDLAPRQAPYAAHVALRPALTRGAIRRSFVSIRRVVQVRLDGGLRASQPTGDLRGRESLVIAIVTRQRSRPSALLHTINSRHRRRRYRSQPTVTACGHRVIRPTIKASASVAQLASPSIWAFRRHASPVTSRCKVEHFWSSSLGSRRRRTGRMRP